MPLRVYYQNDPDQPCTIRPTPLVSIATNVLETPGGEPFGVTYNITLTGTLLADEGSPYALKQDGSLYSFYGTAPTTFVGPYGGFDSTVSHYNGNHPPNQQIDILAASNAIFSKQKILRALFSIPGQKLEITDFNDDEATIILFPRSAQVSFAEGIYVEKCDYTITFECDTILDKNLNVAGEGSYIAQDGIFRIGKQESDLLGSLSGAFIRDFSEDWAIEEDDSLGESPQLPRSFRITHNINATGKKHYTPSGDVLRAWEQARTFVQSRLSETINGYPNVMGRIGSGTLNLINSYGGFNHIRSENLSESNGTYAVTETWLIASGLAYENFTVSVTSTIDNPFVTVSIDGNIKGLSQVSPSGYGGIGPSGITAYDNALNKYNMSSFSGQFGMSCPFYQRANNTVAVQLNSQPKSITVGANEYVGEINYNLQFDNRPTNIISGALTENITVNDTYPGDVFAVIPVIGRPTGPILQYIGSRTEYQRSISVNLVMDYTKVPYGSGRSTLLLKKPSVVEPMATQLANLIRELSPAGEPNIRKYFVNPSPQETWSPHDGVYNFNLTWTYELGL